MLSKHSEKSSYSVVQRMILPPLTSWGIKEILGLVSVWYLCGPSHFVDIISQFFLPFMYSSIVTLYVCLCVSLYVLSFLPHAFVFYVLYSWLMAFSHHLLLICQDPDEIPPLPWSSLLPPRPKSRSIISEFQKVQDQWERNREQAERSKPFKFLLIKSKGHANHFAKLRESIYERWACTNPDTQQFRSEICTQKKCIHQRHIQECL